jgi:hypothetical protein
MACSATFSKGKVYMRWTLEELSYRVLPRVDPGRALADVEWRTLSRVAEAMHQSMSERPSAEEVADNVERFLSIGRWKRAFRVRALLTLIEWLPLTTHRKSFSSLSVEQRRELIAKRFVAGEHVWAVCAKVRLLVVMGTFGDARARAATGYIPVAERTRFREPKTRAGTRLQISAAP